MRYRAQRSEALRAGIDALAHRPGSDGLNKELTALAAIADGALCTVEEVEALKSENDQHTATLAETEDLTEDRHHEWIENYRVKR